MSRRDAARLADIVAAIAAIKTYLAEGDLGHGMVYDACRIRLLEVGEAVKGISPELLAYAPEVPWQDVARMRDHLAHRYFDTEHSIVRHVLEVDLPVVEAAVRRLEKLAPDFGTGS